MYALYGVYGSRAMEVGSGLCKVKFGEFICAKREIYSYFAEFICENWKMFQKFFEFNLFKFLKKLLG